MPTETDIRLRSWLDANQRDREQMCRAILALDSHYSDVRPRHPSGGPDGGRDIEAIFDGERQAYAAVGFQNGANDCDEQKRKIGAKFSVDLRSALDAKPELKIFAFLTNLHLTIGEQSEMKEEARKAGIEHCDILDRERLRIELDSPAGFFVRFQFLEIPLSEAEQASFLARYGDRIQQVVSTGFERVERTLNRILFLQEAADVLSGIYVYFRLKKSFSADEIGHFRAFVSIHLHAIKYNILEILFGSSDRQMRFRTGPEGEPDNGSPGIGHGIGSGSWEMHVVMPVPGANGEKSTPMAEYEELIDKVGVGQELVQVGGGSSVGVDPVRAIVAHYNHDDFLLRIRPRLELRDLDGCLFMPIVNESLADKILSIEVFANSYKLAHLGAGDFGIDRSKFETSISTMFTAEELMDPWVRIRPSNASALRLRFDSATPRRVFEHEEIQESE